jgi:hypothetical protein
MDVKIPRKRKERIKLRKTTKRLIALPTSSAVTTQRVKKRETFDSYTAIYKTEKVTVRRSHSPDNTDRRDTKRAEKEEVTILREKGI